MGKISSEGFSPVQPATEYIKKMADGKKKEVEKRLPNTVFYFFNAISYRMLKTVIGKTYNVTVQFSFESFVLLEIFVTPDKTVSLLDQEVLPHKKVIPTLSKPVRPPLVATPWVQSMIEGVKNAVETQAVQKCTTFKALSFRSESTKYGINYLIVVQVSKEHVLQLAMFEELSEVVYLTGIKNGVPPCIPAQFGPVPQVLEQNPPKWVYSYMREAEKQLHINGPIPLIPPLYYAVQIADGGITYKIAAWGPDGIPILEIELFQTMGGQVQLTLADIIYAEPFSIPSKYCQSSTQSVEWPQYPANKIIQDMVDQVKQEVEINVQKTGTLKAMSFRSRPADGINFLIRVKLTTENKKEFVYGLGIYKSLDGKIALTGITSKISPSTPFYPIPGSMYEPATESTHKMANDVKGIAATRLGMVFKKYLAICYSSNVNKGEEDDVEGVNYHVIVWISDVNHDFLNLEILVSLEGIATLKNQAVGVDQYKVDAVPAPSI